MSCDTSPNLNSNNNYFLTISKAKLIQASIPNTGWSSTQLAGEAYESSSGSSSVTIGVSYGVLSATLEKYTTSNACDVMVAIN